jgi:hypothetical protein
MSSAQNWTLPRDFLRKNFSMRNPYFLKAQWIFFKNREKRPAPPPKITKWCITKVICASVRHCWGRGWSFHFFITHCATEILSIFRLPDTKINRRIGLDRQLSPLK